MVNTGALVVVTGELAPVLIAITGAFVPVIMSSTGAKHRYWPLEPVHAKVITGTFAFFHIQQC